jgi:hypothetical protein
LKKTNNRFSSQVYLTLFFLNSFLNLLRYVNLLTFLAAKKAKKAKKENQRGNKLIFNKKIVKSKTVKKSFPFF